MSPSDTAPPPRPPWSGPTLEDRLAEAKQKQRESVAALRAELTDDETWTTFGIDVGQLDPDR